MPSLLRVLTRWALSINQAGVVVDLRSVLFDRKRPAISSMWSSCDSVSVRASRLRVIFRPMNLSTQAEILLLERLP
eukprot:2212052-Pleurochrysis_carterae.AAC.2